MSLEACPSCGYLTRVYADAGNREHHLGCKFEKKDAMFSDEEITAIAKELAKLEDTRFPEYANGNWDEMDQTQQDAYKDNVTDAMQAFDQAGYVFVKSDWLSELYAAYEKQNAREG